MASKHKHLKHHKHRKQRPWSIEPDSVCARSVDYDGVGTLTVSFIKGGQSYDYDVSKSEAREAKRAAKEGGFGEWLNDTLL